MPCPFPSLGALADTFHLLPLPVGGQAGGVGGINIPKAPINLLVSMLTLQVLILQDLEFALT